MSRTYEQLEPVISALDERIKTNLGAYPTDTAEGPIASFADGADDIPLKSLVVDINPVQSGSGDPSPDNVRPISGWTGMNVSRTGKNLFGGLPFAQAVNAASYSSVLDETTGTVTFNRPTSIDGSNKRIIFDRLPARCTFIVAYSNTGTNECLCVRYTDGTFSKISLASSGGNKTVVVVTTNANKTPKMLYMEHFTNATTTLFYNECGVFEGVLTADDFEPYNGQIVTVDWQTEAGTVYGGKLDVLSGVLTVDRYFIDPSQWTQYGASNGYIAYRIQNLPEGRYGVGHDAENKPLSNIIAEFGSFSSSTMNKNIIQPPMISLGAAYMALQDGIDPTTVELSYLVANPHTIQLTPHEVRSLLGQNNIFADTGDTTAEYRADTKLYIERLTEPDADMIADANITSGSYFMVGNTLYKATANIASGSAVIEGTNAIRKSLSEALNEINQ